MDPFGLFESNVVDETKLSKVVSPNDDLKSSLIAITLQVGVPIVIDELKKQGGPIEFQIMEAQGFRSTLGSKGDVLLYGSKYKGEAAGLMNMLIRHVAVMSFCPGGVRTFGCHFQANV